MGAPNEGCKEVLLYDAWASSSFVVHRVFGVPFRCRFVNGVVYVEIPFMGGCNVTLARVERGDSFSSRLLFQERNRHGANFVFVNYVVLLGSRVVGGLSYFTFLHRDKGPRKDNSNTSLVVRVSKFKNVGFFYCGIVCYVRVFFLREERYFRFQLRVIGKEARMNFPGVPFRASLIRNRKVSTF